MMISATARLASVQDIQFSVGTAQGGAAAWAARSASDRDEAGELEGFGIERGGRDAA
jgi:hypothetical protein